MRKAARIFDEVYWAVAPIATAVFVIVTWPTEAATVYVVVLCLACAQVQETPRVAEVWLDLIEHARARVNERRKGWGTPSGLGAKEPPRGAARDLYGSGDQGGSS